MSCSSFAADTCEDLFSKSLSSARVSAAGFECSSAPDSQTGLRVSNMSTWPRLNKASNIIDMASSDSENAVLASSTTKAKETCLEKASSDIEVLDSSDSEHALPSSSTGTAKNTTASDQKPSDKLPVVFPVKVELADEEGRDANKKKARYTFWAAHEGFGLCKGSNQLPCCFGPDGKPANAAPNGRCDLCSTDNLEALHDGMPQKITHLLADLEGKPLQHALIRVGIALGPEARAEYSMRRERAVRRRNPGRPKRGPRKPKVPE